MAWASPGVGAQVTAMACTELRTPCGLAHGASFASRRLVYWAQGAAVSGSGSHEALALGARVERLKEPVGFRGL